MGLLKLIHAKIKWALVGARHMGFYDWLIDWSIDRFDYHTWLIYYVPWYAHNHPMFIHWP